MKYPDLHSQAKRYTEAGFESVTVVDLLDIYNKFLDKKENARIQTIEFFDEYEEWQLILGHYCLAWAYQDKINKDKLTSQLGFKW